MKFLEYLVKEMTSFKSNSFKTQKEAVDQAMEWAKTKRNRDYIILKSKKDKSFIALADEAYMHWPMNTRDGWIMVNQVIKGKPFKKVK